VYVYVALSTIILAARLSADICGVYLEKEFLTLVLLTMCLIIVALVLTSGNTYSYILSLCALHGFID